MKKTALFLFILQLSSKAVAEYRVYQYAIQNIGSSREKSTSYQELSTLPPQAFHAYHGGYQNIRVDLLRTWICPGHTGAKKEYCPNPYTLLIQGGKNE